MGDWRGTGKRDYIHGAYMHETRCVRSVEFKYIQNYAPVCDPSKPVELTEAPDVHGPRGVDSKPLPCIELYDLNSDPHEQVNLAGEPGYQSAVKRHRAELYRWMKRVDDPCLKLPQPEMPRAREQVQRLI
jgi:arylsulfatase A-like enzyme